MYIFGIKTIPRAEENGAIVRILLLSNLYLPHVEGGAEILVADIARARICCSFRRNNHYDEKQ